VAAGRAGERKFNDRNRNRRRSDARPITGARVRRGGMLGGVWLGRAVRARGGVFLRPVDAYAVTTTMAAGRETQATNMCINRHPTHALDGSSILCFLLSFTILYGDFPSLCK
jgi:hypothetical protein